ncbi:MAG: DUF2304 domain-containing protein [Candidatus Brocadiales bacterium]|nr:DUF2304 domain-containing protein [Candidatus Brocadiales bacterium]
MITRIQILSITASLFLIGTTVELIRQRQLEEKYAISWLLTCIFFLVCSINLEIVEFLSDLTGVAIPSNFLFLLAFFFLIIVTLSLTVMASNESRRSRKFAQELSILKFDVEQLSKRFKHFPFNKETRQGQDKPKKNTEGDIA